MLNKSPDREERLPHIRNLEFQAYHFLAAVEIVGERDALFAVVAISPPLAVFSKMFRLLGLVGKASPTPIGQQDSSAAESTTISPMPKFNHSSSVWHFFFFLSFSPLLAATFRMWHTS